MAWNNEDLGAWMIKADFPDSEVCGHFGMVIYNEALTPLSFIKNQQLKTRKRHTH